VTATAAAVVTAATVVTSRARSALDGGRTDGRVARSIDWADKNATAGPFIYSTTNVVLFVRYACESSFRRRKRAPTTEPVQLTHVDFF